MGIGKKNEEWKSGEGSGGIWMKIGDGEIVSGILEGRAGNGGMDRRITQQISVYRG
jgi:hypothetical protein